MRPLPVSALVLAFGLAAACSSSSTDSSPTSEAQGPLSGTYSADSLAGTSPFVAITFKDKTHYTYVARSCVEQASSATDPHLEDDPGNPVADNGATPDATDPTDGGCIHTGTYTLSETNLTLTDDGATTSVIVPIAQIASNSTEVTQALKVASLPGSLIVGDGSLLGSSSGAVSQFNAGGTDLRRTGLIGDAATSDSDASSPLLTDQAVALASKWVDVKMPYCQAANGAPEPDKDCVKIHGATCTRTGAADNVAWNAYRSDCSGLVSYAWSLPTPGLTTRQFVPGTAKYIPLQDLAPGDALLRLSHHIVLFKEWTDKAKGAATVIAEPGCNVKGEPNAREEPWSFGSAPGAETNGQVDGKTYYAIRKK